MDEVVILNTIDDDMIIIQLDENPSTGFRWYLDYDHLRLQVILDIMENESPPVQPNRTTVLVGASRLRNIHFVGLGIEHCTTYVTMNLIRKWSRSSSNNQPIKQFQLQVVIRGSDNGGERAQGGGWAKMNNGILIVLIFVTLASFAVVAFIIRAGKKFPALMIPARKQQKESNNQQQQLRDQQETTEECSRDQLNTDCLGV
jgi:predicted secreted protein